MVAITLDEKRRDSGNLITELERAGGRVEGNMVYCPYHENTRSPAGSIQPGEDGQWRYTCHNPECAVHGDYLDLRSRRTGVPVAELMNPAPDPAVRLYRTPQAVRETVKGTIEGEHAYKTEDGHLRFVRFRYRTRAGAKSYASFRPVTGGFIKGEPPAPRILYGLPGIIGQKKVVVVEGEKCVDMLHGFGIPATCSTDGAAAAAKTDWSPCAGKDVTIWPDNDGPGRQYAKDVETILSSLNPPAQVSVVDIRRLSPQAPSGYDVADYVRDGAGQADVVRVLRSATNTGILKKMDDQFEAIANGSYCCVPWKHDQLSYFTQAHLPGSLTVITGGPGTSKSLFLLENHVHWIETGIRAAGLQFEDNIEFYVRRFLAQKTGESGFTNLKWIRENIEEVRVVRKEYAEEIRRFSATMYIAVKERTLDDVLVWIEDRFKDGCRIVWIDPITKARRKGKPWEADDAFLDAAEKLAVSYGGSIDVVTHPEKGGDAQLGNMAGGAAYERFTKTVITIKRHDELVDQDIKPICGGCMKSKYDTTIQAVKARNAPGTGVKLGYRFIDEGLTFDEVGVILKKQKEPKNGKKNTEETRKDLA